MIGLMFCGISSLDSIVGVFSAKTEDALKGR